MNIEPFKNELTLHAFGSLLFICIFGINVRYFFYHSIIFTFNEYIIHRFLLHQTNVPLFSKNHLFHHSYPKQWNYMHISSVTFMSYLYIFVGVLFIFNFSSNVIFSCLSTHFFWYLCFIFFHLFGHLFGKNYFHSIHHIKPSYNYGFSCHFWDIIFGTFVTSVTKRETISFNFLFKRANILLLIPFPFVPIIIRQFCLNFVINDLK